MGRAAWNKMFIHFIHSFKNQIDADNLNAELVIKSDTYANFEKKTFDEIYQLYCQNNLNSFCIIW